MSEIKGLHLRKDFILSHPNMTEDSTCRKKKMRGRGRGEEERTNDKITVLVTIINPTGIQDHLGDKCQILL